MSSEAQRNAKVFERWLDEVVATENRAAAAGFVSPTFTMYSDAGEQRLSLDEWPNWRAEASREENLDEFVRRVGGERQAMPGSVMKAIDCRAIGPCCAGVIRTRIRPQRSRADCRANRLCVPGPEGHRTLAGWTAVGRLW
jgi:hypothetical protein